MNCRHIEPIKTVWFSLFLQSENILIHFSFLNLCHYCEVESRKSEKIVQQGLAENQAYAARLKLSNKISVSCWGKSVKRNRKESIKICEPLPEKYLVPRPFFINTIEREDLVIYTWKDARSHVGVIIEKKPVE
jgi:hypothetical protein